MQIKTLKQLYNEHQGKISDKWEFYLSIYDEKFLPYKNSEVSILEIGVQNGGGLEIYAKYFPTAKKIVGCDINPSCSLLTFKDPRITVFASDANTDKTEMEITKFSDQFDIIIDDGSHSSGDIVKSFARYFSKLKEGGIYIIEDLHCSYWKENEGGLYYPYSSMTFFKLLSDVVNQEHWLIGKTASSLFHEFFVTYDINISNELLATIRSVEFSNSLCIVSRQPNQTNKLGRRIIVGLDSPAVLDIESKILLRAQTANKWSMLKNSPEAILNERNALRLALKSCKNSTSWRITKPVRVVGRIISLIKKSYAVFSHMISNSKALKFLIHNLKTKGFSSIGYYESLLRNKEYAAEVSEKYDLPPYFIKSAVSVARVFLSMKQRSLDGVFYRKFLFYILAFMHGKVNLRRKDITARFFYNVDSPNKIFKICSFLRVSGWCIDTRTNVVAAKVRVRVDDIVYNVYREMRKDVAELFKFTDEVCPFTGFTFEFSPTKMLHRIYIDVEESDGVWTPIHRFFLLNMGGSESDYATWYGNEKKRLKNELQEIERHIGVMLQKPIFTIVIDTRSSDCGFAETVKSISEQIYKNYELYVLICNEDLNSTANSFNIPQLPGGSFKDLNNDFLIFIDSGQILSMYALYEFASVINQDPSIDLIYGDHDYLDANGNRYNPFYKPDWSPDYLETFNYIGFSTCIRTAIVRDVFEIANMYDLVLRVTEKTAKIRHVPKILGHDFEKHFDDEGLDRIAAQNIAALEGRLHRTGRHGVVREHDKYRGCYEIQIELKRQPLVSIIIPTAGKTVDVEGRSLDLIVNIVEQIQLSSYKNIEIIVVDNGDLSSNQKQMLAAANCKNITYTDPVFNIAKKLNLGASIATGELFLLMNDDISILTPSWIEQMAGHFEKSHVGVVGAKLLYPDNTIQHVGVVHNHGNADHVRRYYPGDDDGYYFSTCGVRNFMAVTGAVMMTSSKIYRAVGGYSEELAVSYNDVDFCLKVFEQGFYVVYEPKAELIHMESLSRTPFLCIKELRYFYDRWSSLVIPDPYYNERFLSVAPPMFRPCVNKRLL